MHAGVEIRHLDKVDSERPWLVSQHWHAKVTSADCLVRKYDSAVQDPDYGTFNRRQWVREIAGP